MEMDSYFSNLGWGVLMVLVQKQNHTSRCLKLHASVSQFLVLNLLPRPSKQLGQPGFFSIFFSRTTKASHDSQKENWPSTTCSVLLPAVDQIKGSPIYPLVGSCSGYCVISYFRGLDRYSRRYVDPAVQNASFLLPQTAQLLSCHAYLSSARVLTCPLCPSWRGMMCCCLSGIF